MVGLASVRLQDWPFDPTRPIRDVRNLSGPLGSLVAHALVAAFGRFFAWVVPILLVVLGIGFVTGRTRPALRLSAKSLFILILITSFFALMPATRPAVFLSGSIGRGVAKLVSSVLGEFGGTIILITLLLLVLLTQFRRAAAVLHGAFAVGVPAWGERMGSWAESASRRFHDGIEALRESRRRRREARRAMDADRHGATLPEREPPLADIPVEPPWVERQPEPPKLVKTTPPARRKPPARTQRPPVPGEGVPLERATLPALSILKTRAGSRTGYSSDQLRSWSEVLEGKLANYGIEGRVTAVNQGPLVTTFEFEPSPGVKVKDIVSRADDLALAMRARSLRLIAPIPGRAVVGIEIPNPDQDVVYFGDVLKEIPERLRYSGIMIALGVDAVGKPFHINLCSAPHLLMAGTTGSGKSVCLNGFLASILFQYRPSDVRMLLIDPKMVEMSMFNGIPHLLHPVITDSREAVRVFNFLIREMERRNHLLREAGVKNIESFNSKIALGKHDPEHPVEKLPYIVLVVDELADLMLTKGVDFESLLSRLSNMARAVGIHMIVATQRPSVDVIDGKTKANFPTRIAFRVATKVDSRTILDCMGAEKLLGKGDMLFVDAKHPEALRLHGAWLGDDEVEDLLNHWRQYDFEESHLDLAEERRDESNQDGDKDSYFDDAKEVILRYRQGSTSLLQRKLHVGYARAARILDQLEDAGYVGPPDGSKPREVLIHKDHGMRPNDGA